MAELTEHNEPSEHEHVSTSGFNWLIWAILIGATFLTAEIARIDLGMFNTIVALFIATCKASIVVLFFMHVKYTSEKMTKAVLIAAVFWLILMLVLSLVDYSTRFAG